MHLQAFVQCLHQNTPLKTVMEAVSKKPSIVTDYLDYVTHVAKTTYDDVDRWKAEQETIESQWPVYKDDVLTVSKPAYLSSSSSADDPEGQQWLEAFKEDVQGLQQRKQHHVHVPDENQVRQPLTHCRRKDKPKECKAGFPKVKQLLRKAVVVCRGLAQAMEMTISGRRNQIGCLLGPRNDEWLNGTHPALLAALRCKSDAQLPYCFTTTEHTHTR